MPEASISERQTRSRGQTMASYFVGSDNPLRIKQIKSEGPSQNTEAETVLAEIGRNLVVDQPRLHCIETASKPNVAADGRRIAGIGRSETQVPARIPGREDFQTQARASVPPLSPKSGRVRLSGAMLALAFCATVVGGCASGYSADGAKMGAAISPSPRPRTAQIPLPSQARLQRQPVPDCAFKGQVSTPPTAEETGQRLDYEQQCYRQAEIIVRGRLHRLQDSVHEMIKAVRQR